MISLLKMLFIAIFELLPTSPFQKMIDDLALDFDFLPYLNWFLPFDTCSVMMLTWLDCVLVYYAFVITKKIVMDYLIDIFIKAGGSLVGGVTAIK